MASTGQEAVDLFCTASAPFDVIFMDIEVSAYLAVHLAAARIFLSIEPLFN